MGKAFSLYVASRPAFGAAAEAIRAAKLELARRVGQRLVSKDIPAVFSSQGAVTGDNWWPRHALRGGGPALIGIASRTRFKATPTLLTIYWDWPWAGPSTGSKGGPSGIPGGGRRASPMMWLTFIPGVKSPRELKGTFLRPMKTGLRGGSHVVKPGFVVMQRLKGEEKPRACGLLVYGTSVPERAFGAWFRRYRESAMDEWSQGVAETLRPFVEGK